MALIDEIIKTLFFVRFSFLPVRVISLVMVSIILVIVSWHMRKTKFTWFQKFSTPFFFCIFVMLLGDWIWTLSVQLRWRNFYDALDNQTWLALQPTPFGSISTHDPTRWLQYIVVFLIAVFVLRKYFDAEIFSANKYVALTYLNYTVYWIVLQQLIPAPFLADPDLWKFMPKLAATYGQRAYYTSIFLADIISRFCLVIPCALSWIVKKK